MDERLSRLEAQLEKLRSHIASLERRLAALEGRGPADLARPETAQAVGEVDALERLASLGASDLGAVVALAGRTLVVLAGAYLLRALTESGRLAAGTGILLGLAFALCWIIMADRSGAHGRNLSAVFHGVAFALIAFPLLFEATTRFQFLSTGVAAAVLGGSAAVALVVAARRRLQGVAWVTALGVLATAGALMLATAELGPPALCLVLLGVATLWLGEWVGWTLLRWPFALAADLSILVLTGRVVTPDVADAPAAAIAAQAFLFFGYLGSIGIRTLCLGRDVAPFEVLQWTAAVSVGLGGAAYVTGASGGALPLGGVALTLAVGCYGVAVAFLERWQGRRWNFYFYSSAGLVFALAGWALALPEAGLGLVYAALGLTSAWSGRLSRRLVFQVHGAAYLVAAVVAGGLLTYVGYGFGLPLVPAQAPSATMVGVLALCVGAVWGLGAGGVEGPPRPAARVPRLVGIVVALGGVLGIAVAYLAPAIGGGTAPAVRAGLVATLRTGLLVGTILVLGLAARALEFVEGAWLVYALLILTGVKFVLEDLRSGLPATLFVSFGLYGLALLVGPWLCPRPGGTSGRQP